MAWRRHDHEAAAAAAQEADEHERARLVWQTGHPHWRAGAAPLIAAPRAAEVLASHQAA